MNASETSERREIHFSTLYGNKLRRRASASSSQREIMAPLVVMWPQTPTMFPRKMDSQSTAPHPRLSPPLAAVGILPRMKTPPRTGIPPMLRASPQLSAIFPNRSGTRVATQRKRRLAPTTSIVYSLEVAAQDRAIRRQARKAAQAFLVKR